MVQETSTEHQFQLKETKQSNRVFAALKLTGAYPSNVRGVGIYNGRDIELKMFDDGLYFSIFISVVGDNAEWGRFRSHPYLHDEPGTLQLADGRTYYLKKTAWDKFRLFTSDGRTVAVTTYQSLTMFKILFELIDATEKDSDYPLLALAVLMPIVLWNHQTG